MSSLCDADGRQETVMFDKITSRIQKLCYGLNSEFVQPVSARWKSLLSRIKQEIKRQARSFG